MKQHPCCENCDSVVYLTKITQICYISESRSSGVTEMSQVGGGGTQGEWSKDFGRHRTMVTYFSALSQISYGGTRGNTGVI